jgi:hypothetical protein
MFEHSETWVWASGETATMPFVTVHRVENRRVELATTTTPDERQRVKAVILVPHRGARIRVKAVHHVKVDDGVAVVATCPVAQEQPTA